MPRHKGVARRVKRHSTPTPTSSSGEKKIKLECAEDSLLEEKRKVKNLKKKVGTRDVALEGYKKKSKVDSARIASLEKVFPAACALSY